MPCKSGCKEGNEEDTPGVCPGARCKPKKEVETFKPCPNLSKCPQRKSMEDIKKESENYINELPNTHSATKVLK